MNRLILLAVAGHASCVSTAIANDYLLRLDTIGYVEKLASEEEPHDTTLRSIEVITRPQLLFHARVSVEKETLKVSGKLRPADNGRFTLEIRYDHSVDTGLTVTGDDGTQDPIIGKHAVQTIVTVPVGTRTVIGGCDTERDESGKPKRKSKIQYVVILTEYEPLND